MRALVITKPGGPEVLSLACSDLNPSQRELADFHAHLAAEVYSSVALARGLAARRRVAVAVQE